MRWFAGLEQFRGYRAEWLRTDAVAGVTVAAYLIPQVMAYATVAGLPPVVGLWTALGPLVVYVLLGSSRQLSVGPESTTALLTAVTLVPLANGDARRYATLAAVLALLVGAICLVAAVARLGILADLLSKPVLVGYLAGTAGIMIAGQLGRVSGVPVTGRRFPSSYGRSRNISATSIGPLSYWPVPWWDAYWCWASGFRMCRDRCWWYWLRPSSSRCSLCSNTEFG